MHIPHVFFTRTAKLLRTVLDEEDKRPGYVVGFASVEDFIATFEKAYIA